MKKLIIINGPNLNLLGTREPEIYGGLTFTEFLEILRKKYTEVAIDYYQSNIEGELIDKIQEAGLNFDG
ncbi:MAG: type II 3-dehydroquinate dehydratase, partial [Flavobacteriaceae bacterium]|nr:type II 3-dehydroquinate dehydratase [Flavobacteriaceae bacterium]